jgi:hypothetical protein
MPTPQETEFEAAKTAYLAATDLIAANGPVPAHMDALTTAHWRLVNAGCALPLVQP